MAGEIRPWDMEAQMLARTLRNGLLATAAGAVAMCLGTSAVMASPLGFDPDGANVTTGGNPTLGELNGGAVGSSAAAALVDKFQLVTASPNYNIIQNFGADGIFNNGDTFTETARFNVTQSLEPTPLQYYTSGAHQYEYIDVTLAGHVDNVSNPGDLTGSTYSIIFDTGAANWYFDSNGTHATTPGTHNADETNIASLSLTGGGANDFSLNVGQGPTASVGVDFQFASTAPGYFFLQNLTTDLSSQIPPLMVLAFANGSVTVQTLTAAGPGSPCATGQTCAVINVTNNGTTLTTTVPEPATLSIFGAGLLVMGAGVAASRRRKKDKGAAA